MLNRSRKRGDKPWHWICNDHSFQVAILENLPSHNTSCSFRNAQNLQCVCLNRNHKCPAALRITGPSCNMPKLISKQDTKEKGLVALCSNPWTTYTFTLTPCNSNALYIDNTLRNLSCMWHCRRSYIHVMKMRAPQNNHTTADVVLPSEQHTHCVNTRKTRHWKDIFPVAFLPHIQFLLPCLTHQTLLVVKGNSLTFSSPVLHSSYTTHQAAGST